MGINFFCYFQDLSTGGQKPGFLPNLRVSTKYFREKTGFFESECVHDCLARRAIKSDLPGMILRRNRVSDCPAPKSEKKTRLPLTSHTRYEYAKVSKSIEPKYPRI